MTVLLQELSVPGALVSGLVATALVWKGPRHLGLKVFAGIVALVVLLVALTYPLKGTDWQLVPVTLASQIMVYVVPGAAIGVVLGLILRRFQGVKT